MIEAKNVNFYYGDFHALKDINMKMEYPITTVVCTVLDNFMRALATEKGLREIEKYEEKTKDSQ